MKKVALLLVLIEIIAFPLLLIWVLKTNNPAAITLLIIVCIVGTFSIASTVMCGMWNPALKHHPPVEPEVDAVRRDFQSFSLGLVNMGWSVHVAVDAHHLHLTPIKPMRMFGARSASIPWSAMKPAGGNRSTVVTLDGRHRLIGPQWCMELITTAGNEDR